MSISRIKTIVIAALVLINGIFLSVIIIDAVADIRSERAAIEDAAAILLSNGITINPDNISSSGSFGTMRTERVHEVEETIAAAVLGESEMTDLGVIFRYESLESGVAEFNSSGGFEMQLNENAIINTAGALKTVEKLLDDMKIEISSITQYSTTGYETVTAIVSYRGVEIFNCAIEFEFSGEQLKTISGRYVTVTRPLTDGVAITTPATAMLAVLGAVKNEVIEVTRIDSLESGYFFRTGPFGEGVLDPVWLVETDTGIYIMDVATGEIEAHVRG